MRDVNLRDIDLKKLRVSRRVVLWLVCAAVLVGGAFVAWHSINNPPRPWLVRWKLNRYLAKQAHTGDFKVDFAFPSMAEMAERPEGERGLTKGSRTGKDFETLREEYITEKMATLTLLGEVKRSEASVAETKPRLDALTKELADAMAANNETNIALVRSNSAALRQQMTAWEKIMARRSELAAKEQALDPVVDDLWEFQRSWAKDSDDSGALSKARAELMSASERSLRDASDYGPMYRVLGQELFVAGRLLESGNPEHRRQGVLLALGTARQALNYVMNGSVAARICEGYVLPHLDLATDRNPRSTFNEDNLLRQCTDYFQRNDEFNNVVRTYEIALENAKSPEQKDRLLAQIARTQEQAGNPNGAIAAIKKIKDTGNYQFLIRRLPRLQEDAKYQK